MHKLEGFEKPSVTKSKGIKIPSITGKLGFSLFLGHREVFIGVSINEVEIERVIRKKVVKVPNAAVKVFRYDPND